MDDRGLHFSVCYGDAKFLTEQGFGLVATLPFIVDAGPAYHRLGSRYLIDRGLGKWHPHTRGSREVEAPAPQTINNYARWLANFLEWAAIRGVDLYTCSYHQHISGQYKSEMVTGLWSKDGKSLEANTINPRISQAGDFLTWLCDKGYRQNFFEVPFEIKQVRVGSATESHGHRTKEIPVRQGLAPKRNGNKKHMPYPNHQAVEEWLERVQTKFGYSYRLICETICLTAVRRAEAAGWRVNTIPIDRSEWTSLIANPQAKYEDRTIKADIVFGAKGKSHQGVGRNGEVVLLDHGDKIGPRGLIHIPLPLADKLHEYLTDPRLRPRAMENLKKRLREQGLTRTEILNRVANTLHLFLDPETGERISDRQLYEAWTGVELPFRGWSPHRGRDWWSCSILMRELDFLHNPDIKVPKDMARTAIMDVINLQIRPQLRHANSDTSLIYLHWAIDRTNVGLAIKYEKAFEDRIALAQADEIFGPVLNVIDQG